MKSNNVKDTKNNIERGFAALSLIEKNSNKILELGTGSGEFMSELKGGGAQCNWIRYSSKQDLVKKRF